MRMEQDALAVSRGFSKNPIYTESCRCYETYRFYRFTDLRICTTFAAPGPTRARTRATTRSVAARRERCVNSFPRAHAHEKVGAARPVRWAAAARACEVVGAGQVCCISSSGVLPVGWGTAGLRSCWEAGPRARAHAESRIDFGTKSAYFGPIPAVRLGSVRPGGGAGVRDHQLEGAQGHQPVAPHITFPDSHWPIKHIE